MNSVFNVADWFLAKESMTHKKLQRLCYYAQAWSYAIQPEPISDAVFEAWEHGPVCSELYQKYKGYGFSRIPKSDSKPFFTHEEEDFLDGVWETYGEQTANSLEALSHSEPPWQIARFGLLTNEPSRKEISPQDMAEYYRSIYTGGDA